VKVWVTESPFVVVLVGTSRVISGVHSDDAKAGTEALATTIGVAHAAPFTTLRRDTEFFIASFQCLMCE
jgi:hypothetical protein